MFGKFLPKKYRKKEILSQDFFVALTVGLIPVYPHPLPLSDTPDFFPPLDSFSIFFPIF